MSDTTTTSDQDLNLNPEGQTTDTGSESKSENDLPKHLRSVIDKQSRELKKALAELEAIKKADEDKSKTLEEKLAEKELALKSKDEEIQKTLKQTSLEKQLLKSNINPEFVDLMLEKGLNIGSDNVVEDLKTLYPSAFTITTEQKPIGKVGTNITTGDTTIFTKEKALEILNSGDNALYQKYHKDISKVLNS